MTPLPAAAWTQHSPSIRSTVIYWVARGTLRQIYRAWPLTERGIARLGVVERFFDRFPDPAGVSITFTTLGQIPVETTKPLRTGVAGPPEVTVLYLHGGAFVFCGPATHRRLCARLTIELGVPVHSIRYRSLPETDLGGIVDDAYQAYQALLEQLSPHSRIVVAGDSAGGFLAVKLCELAARDGLQAPAALVAYSPLIDLDGELDDGPWDTRDAYQPARTLRRLQQIWGDATETLPGARALQELDPAIFPPTLITLAAGELVEHAALSLTNHLAAAGRTIETHRWRRGVHAFPVLDYLTPESRSASQITIAFLRRTLGL